MKKFTTWQPIRMLSVDCDPLRFGMIGRAMPIFISGVECIVVCKTDADVALVANKIADNFDPTLINKATIIESLGIEVDLDFQHLSYPSREPSSVEAIAEVGILPTGDVIQTPNSADDGLPDGRPTHVKYAFVTPDASPKVVSDEPAKSTEEGPQAVRVYDDM